MVEVPVFLALEQETSTAAGSSQAWRNRLAPLLGGTWRWPGCVTRRVRVLCPSRKRAQKKLQLWRRPVTSNQQQEREAGVSQAEPEPRGTCWQRGGISIAPTDKTPQLFPQSLALNGDLGRVRAITISEARRGEQEKWGNKHQQKEISTQDDMAIKSLKCRNEAHVVNDSQNTHRIGDSSLKGQK